MLFLKAAIPEGFSSTSCIKYWGVMCVYATPFYVANILTSDNYDARKPPTISYMWALTPNPEKTFRFWPRFFLETEYKLDWIEFFNA
jgi:hypothetical protein